MAKEITLDANGFASESGNITVYNYDGGTGVFLGITIETLMAGVGIPAHSTITKPPAVEPGKVAAWNVEAVAWEAKDDHRGETVYSTLDGSEVTVTDIGDYPPKTTTSKPATPYDNWDGKKWVTDKEAQKLGQIAEADAQKELLIAAANACINEQNWPSKLALGRLSDADKAKFNAWLDYIDAVTAVSTSTAPDITWPEKPAS